MIGKYMSFLMDLAKYLVSNEEYDKAAKVNETAAFLLDTWSELLKTVVAQE